MTPAQLARALASLMPTLQRAILAQLQAWQRSASRASLAALTVAVEREDARTVVRLELGDATANSVVIGPPLFPDAARAFEAATPAAIAAASRTEQAIVRAAADAAVHASRLASAALPPVPPSRLALPSPGRAPLSGVLTVTQTTIPGATATQAAVNYGGDALRYLQQIARQGLVDAVAAGNAAGVNPRETARLLREIVGLGESQAQWVANLRTELEKGLIRSRQGAKSGYENALDRQLLNGPIRQTVAARARSGKPLTTAEIDKIVAAYAEKWRAWHAETIARTVSLDLLRSATLAKAKAAAVSGVYGDAPITKRWATILDGRERPAHHELNGVTIDLHAQWLDDGVLRDVPGGYNCYAGDTVVRGDVRLIMRSWYEGPIVQLVLSGGAQLTVTPNHPVLTSEGLAAAGTLNESHDVLCDSIGTGGASASPLADMHNDQRPATIEEVWHAAEIGRGVHIGQLVREDFHGDAVFSDGDVEVIAVDGQLLNDLHAMSADRISDGRLKWMHEPQPFLTSARTLLHDGAGIDVATARGVSAREHLSSLRGGHLLPLEALSIGTATNSDTTFAQPQFDGSTTCADSVGQRLERLAGSVRRDEGRHIKGESLHGFTPQRVVSMHRSHHVGWVYDTMTSSGLQSANNITVSNCRCAMVIRVGISSG